jgi:hypothetical protein
MADLDLSSVKSPPKTSGTKGFFISVYFSISHHEEYTFYNYFFGIKIALFQNKVPVHAAQKCTVLRYYFQS